MMATQGAAAATRRELGMKRIVLMALVALGALAGAVDGVQAQTRADSADVLMHAARQLTAQGEAAAARALLDYIERQFAGTAAAAEVQRERLAMRRAPEAERPGRTELMLFGTTYGAWLGIAVPLMFRSEEPAAYGLGLLAGAPAGFLAARAYANAFQPTEGQTRAITFGGSWGTWQGFGWGEVLDIGSERYYEPCPPESPNLPCGYVDSQPEARVTVAVIGGLAGIATGAILTRKPITAGTAAAVGSGGLWGTWFGFTGGIVAGLEDDTLLATTLVAGNAALVALGIAAPAWQTTEGRVRLVNVGGVIGALAGVGIVLISQPRNDEVIAGIPMVMSAAGLIAAVQMTRDRDLVDAPGGGQGALINRDGGRWALDMPQAGMTMQRVDGAARPAAYVPLLKARF
jgi:hypothetical protein